MATATKLRRDLANLTTLAERDLAALWRQVSTAAQAREALEDILPSLIRTYGVAAGAVAADWYDEARDKAGVGGSFRAFPVEMPDPGVDKLAGWALAEGNDLVTSRSLVAGGMQRRIANVARGTVVGSSVADPRAGGWMRVGAGACAFCRMLIARGAVYTEATADFGAHDHCGCQAVPKFPGAVPTDVRQYVDNARGRSDATKAADNARAREWIDTHLADAPTAPPIP